MPTKREQFVQSVRAQRLGARMRELREERGLTLKYIAAYLGVEFSTLARYERAEWPFRREHVIALLDVYGVHDEQQRQALISLAQDAWRLHQWQHDFGGALLELTAIDHLWLEERAAELKVYATMLVPELLQSRDYAETIIRRTHGGASPSLASKVDKLVREHLVRQEVLDDKPPKRLTVLMDERVLHQPVGGRLVLVQQLDHLVRAVTRPHVEVRLVPPVGWHEGVYGSFTLYELERPYPPVALVEHLGGRLLLEAAAAKAYSEAFDHIKELATSPEQAVSRITELAEELA